MKFVKHVWPDFVEGSHHKIVAEKFNQIAEGKIKRLIINMPPRHTKSEFASYLLPAWMVGRNPKLKIIQSTNTTELSVRFGRKAKQLLDSQEYQGQYLKLDSEKIHKPQVSGRHNKVVSIMQLVSGVRDYRSWCRFTYHRRSTHRTRCNESEKPWKELLNGIRQALVNVSNQAVQLFSS